jgi:hypothetical protein
MVKYVFLALAISGIASLVRLFWTGRVYARRGRFIGTRQTAPVDFWLAVAISMAFFIIGLVTFLYMYSHSIN